MSTRKYNNSNMKPGESAPRHQNTNNNYQQNNSRPVGNFHNTMTSNTKPMHNQMPNNPQHIPSHVQHNIPNHIHLQMPNQMNNVAVNPQNFAQTPRPRPTTGHNPRYNRPNNQFSNYQAIFDPNLSHYQLQAQHGFIPPSIYSAPPGHGHPYMMPQFYPPNIQVLSSQIPQLQPGNQIPPQRLQQTVASAPQQSSMPNEVIQQPIAIDPTKIPSSQPQTQISQPPAQSNRKRKAAILQDPTTGRDIDIDEIAKMPIEPSANQNANTQITVTNQVVVLENHNEQLKNKNDEQPSQVANVEKKNAVEQQTTQVNRNQVPQQQQQQTPKQETPVVEQDKVDDKIEVKKVEHKQPLLQNPVKPDADVNNRENHFGRQSKLVNSMDRGDRSKRASYSDKDHPFNSTASSAATFNRSIDSNGHSPNSSFNASAINFHNNSNNESLEFNGSFNSFDKKRKEGRNYKQQKDFGRDRRDNRGDNRKDRYQRRPNNHDFNSNEGYNRANRANNSVINNSSFHNNYQPHNHSSQNNQGQKLYRSISTTSNGSTANTTSSSNKSNQTVNSNQSKFSYSDVLQNKSTVLADNKNESNEFSSETSQPDLNFSGSSEATGDKTTTSGSDQSLKVDPSQESKLVKEAEKVSSVAMNGTQPKTILSKNTESGSKLNDGDKEPKVVDQPQPQVNLDQRLSASQAWRPIVKDHKPIASPTTTTTTAAATSKINLNSNVNSKVREPYVAKSKRAVLGKKSKDAFKKSPVFDEKADGTDVNKEAPKNQMVNLEEKLDKLKINEQVKPQDDKQQEKPVVKQVVNHKEEAKEPESKEKPVVEDKAKEVPDKKADEPLDKPNQQNVPKASVPSEPQQAKDVPAVKPQTQQSADAKRSSQVKAQSKSTEIISYDVDFLKKLQYSSFSIEKPNFGNLSSKVEILLNEPRRQDDSSIDFEPQYLKMNSNRNSLSHGHRSMQMGPRMNSDNKMPRKIIASTSLNRDVVLNTAKYSWKLANKEKKSAAEYYESTEGLLAKARGMLNKLTPQNFDKLSQGFLELGIDTEEKLKRMIELIFDKAVDEPAFCDQYALLCKKMSSIAVDVKDKDKKIKFNTLLLERCQTCFEKDKYKDLDLDKRLKEIADCEDKEKKQQLIDELDEDKRLIRKKSLGNIKLIGALYKNDRLKDEIMNLCIDTLLNDNDEDSLECLCSLLKSIGEKYERSIQTNQKKSLFNNQMNKLEAIVKENKIASRIKFLIMDILDMRKENWKPRKLQDVNKPKKIDEVHEDIKKEEEQSNIQYSQLAKRNDSIKKRNDWMGSGSRKSQQSSNDAISNLRKLNEQRINSPNLGPGGPTFGMGGQTAFASWSQGASGAKTSIASTSQDRKVNQWQQRNPTNDRSQPTPPPVKAQRQFRGNYTLLEENFDFISQLSDFLKAYIKSGSIDKLVDSIYDTCTEECVHLFVVAAIDCACESLLKNIDQVGEVLANLVIVKKVISYSQFHKGLKHHLDQSEDIVTDVPKFHEYIGHILSHFFNKLPDTERRSFLKEALQPCINLGTSLLMIIHMIKHLTRDDVCQDISEPAKKWVASNLDWNDFLKENSEQYLKDSFKKYDLTEFVAELNNCKLISNKSVETSNLINQILTSNFDEVSKILEKNISPNDKELNKRLISAFVERCILDSTDFANPSKSCDKNYTFNEAKFESKIKSISFELFKDEEYQLEVIYSACKVDHDRSNPKDLLFNLFNFLLNDVNLVKKDTFIKWYKENKKDRVGNGIAIMNMKRFIDNLNKQAGNDD